MQILVRTTIEPIKDERFDFIGEKRFCRRIEKRISLD